MKFQLLPSTFDEHGAASVRQHLMSIIVDDCVAIDAGSLAFACTKKQREQVRDIVLTHTHLDHIAGLPLYIDDLFSTLTEPIRIHATSAMIEVLERDIFNWAIYPRFSELSNANCAVVEYRGIENGQEFSVKHLKIKSVVVNHNLSATGFVISDGDVSIGITGDTAETDEIWNAFNDATNLKAVMVECAFPNELDELAFVSNHLTPQRLMKELEKFDNATCPVFAINLKPMHRETIVRQIEEYKNPRIEILDVGRVYDW